MLLHLGLWGYRENVETKDEVRITDDQVAEAPRPIFSKNRKGETDDSKPVVVIGGGLAGMAAAIGLRQAGREVCLIEAKQRLGGRVGSFDDSTSGQSIDYCQHVGMACCTNLVRFLEMTGTLSDWRREETLHFVSSRGKPLPFRANALPAPLHLSGLLNRWPELTWLERLQIVRGIWSMMRSPELRASNELASEWLKRNGQTPGTIRKFWATIMVSALGEQIDRVSIGAARKVLIDGFAVHRDAYHLLVPEKPLSEIFGTSLIERLRGMGIEVRLQTRIDRLLFQGSKIEEVVLSNGESIVTSHVVVAVPWNRIGKLLETAFEKPQTVLPENREGGEGNLTAIAKLLDSSRRIESSPITGVHLWWDRAWLAGPHAIFVDRLCQWIFASQNPRREQGLSNGSAEEHYYQVVISGSRQLPRGDGSAIVQAVVNDLQAIFPKLREAKLLRWKVVTDPHSVFSITPTCSNLRPEVDALSQHGLWLAGDWIDTGWPATMEGAVRSGFMAAESVLAATGLPSSIIAPDLAAGHLAAWLIKK